MKSRTLTWITAITLFAAVAFPVQLAAQLPRYKLIDLGTLGGPNSYQDAPGQTVNNRGEAITFADTPIPDPFAPNCFQVDCLISHAIKWHKGVRTDLGALPGINDSVPTWITPNGLIAGLSENGEIDPLTAFPELRAVLWNKDGTIVDLGTLGGNSSQAFGVNSRGQAVGVALNTVLENPLFASFMNIAPAATQARAFLWQDGSMQDLGTLGGSDADAQGVNERGQVVGFSFTDSSSNATTGLPTVHPFVWENGRMVDLHSLGGTLAFPGGFFAPAPTLNNRGQVVGTSTLKGDQTWHPFLWERGVLKDLGTLGGNNGEAFFVSESGDVVGRADVSPFSTNHHAFRWKNGVMKDLGVLAPCLNSTAVGVNSQGQAVGDTGRCPGPGHPFLSEHGEPMVDLNTLVLPGSDLTLESVAFINDRGEIAGAGVLPTNGATRAVLLVPASKEEIEAAEALAQASPPRATQVRRGAIENSERLGGPRSRMLDAWRARLAQRYHISGLAASSRD